MPTESQIHPLKDGSLTIYKDGRHQYWTDDDTTKRPSVTTLTSYLSGDSFSAGVGYAVKQLNMGVDPKAATKDAAEEGNQLHADIETFIKSDGRTMAENPLFTSFYHELGNLNWIASELFVYNPELLYGGTVDGIVLSGDAQIWDFKTVNPESWEKYGSSLRKVKDSAQLAGYALALGSMSSIYDIGQGYIAYILRDGSAVAVEPVDLEWGKRLFLKSKSVYEEIRGD